MWKTKRGEGKMSGLNIVMIIGLGMLSIIDIKSKKLPIWLIEVFAIICFILRWFEGISVWNFLLGLLPGIVLLLLAICSGEKIGIGDAFVVGTLGIGYAIENVISILAISLFFIAIWAIGLLIVKKANKKTELPFLPYLFVGHLLVCLVN